MAKPVLQLPLAQDQPSEPMNIRFQLYFANQGQPYQCPGFRVVPGTVVTLRTANGSVINANPCYIAEDPEALLQTNAAFVAPPGADVTVPWPITNTCQIWATGSAGDGLLVTVQRAQVG